jgi:hypothetical protein
MTPGICRIFRGKPLGEAGQPGHPHAGELDRPVQHPHPGPVDDVADDSPQHGYRGMLRVWSWKTGIEMRLRITLSVASGRGVG